MDAREMMRSLTGRREYRDQVVHARVVEPREAAFGEPATPLAEVLASLLRRQNIFRLYSHQASALDAISAGRNVVVVTSTASGKTLCYQLPILQALLDDPDARALCLYPTKALTQDQCAAFQRWAAFEELEGVLRPAVYDGDTPTHARKKIRGDANVLLTNPDMLHVGMLPYHGKWAAMLRYIVIDELHTYRGIFGSHVAGVLRRLLRMCEHYGSSPQVIGCSATIANPVELAENLIARPVTLVDNDGAPRGRQYFVLWNPPFVGEDNVARRSANVEAVDLLVELVSQRAQTIVFGKARIVVELVYKYAMEALERGGGKDLAQRIRPYRGGYLPGERRKIEEELFAGRLLAVTATNALELGIDVGSMDAAILVGFPGTICSTWQQAGRAGRASQESLVLLVGYNDPIDQYIMRHPEFLFGAPHECGIVDPYNPHILASQLACACFEKPLTEADEAHFGPLAGDVAEMLAEEGKAKRLGDRLYWRSTEMPAIETSLRNISPHTYSIVDDSKGGTVIGNVDSISAPELVYPGAVYLHERDSYVVRELDSEAQVARVEPAEVDYYTQPILASSCRLMDPAERRDYLRGELAFGPADVTWQTTAFRKIKYYTMEMVGQSQLDLPAQTLRTTACWWTVGPEARANVKSGGYRPIEAMLGMRNVMLAALSTLAMADRRDIHGMVDSANLGEPTIVIYDRYDGGMGFAQRGYELIDEWVELCRRIVTECPCEGGCPSCVGLVNLRPPLHQDPDLGGQQTPVPNKDATALLLRILQRQGQELADAAAG